MKLNALDWVVIAAVTVVLICLAMRAFSDGESLPNPEVE